MRFFLAIFFCIASLFTVAQSKRPISHNDYDGWRSAGERSVSNDGNLVVYTINPQEGDGELFIYHVKNKRQTIVPRGYGAIITEDSRFVIMKIKPKFADTRKAKIQKKKAADLPKDSLMIFHSGPDTMHFIANIKDFKTAEKGKGWVAYQTAASSDKKKVLPDSTELKVAALTKIADSIIRASLDSINGNIKKEDLVKAMKKAVRSIYKNADEMEDFFEDEPEAPERKGDQLVVRDLVSGKEWKFKDVADFKFDKEGQRILIQTTKDKKDTLSKALMLLFDTRLVKTDTIFSGFNDIKGSSFDETGLQLAFMAERDSSAKALQHFYKLYYFTPGQDSAIKVCDNNIEGMRLGWTISEHSNLRFSKDGRKLYFGTSPINPPKDTTLVDFELARLDIWHFNDDYLQPQQLKQLSARQKRNFTAVWEIGKEGFVQLGDDDAENVTLVDEGNADWVLAQTTKGNRKSTQWEGRSKYTSYKVSTITGERKKIFGNGSYSARTSPSGKFVYWYNAEARNYFAYNIALDTILNITALIKEPLYDVENDVPDHPSSAGEIGWTEDDKYLLVNDVYDIWRVDPTGKEKPVNITNGYGKKNKTNFNYVRLDKEERYFTGNILLRSFNTVNKHAGFYKLNPYGTGSLNKIIEGPNSYGTPVKAKHAESYLLSRANIKENELFFGNDLGRLTKLTNISAQQDSVNWLNVELVKWKMFDGKMSEGLLFKPDDFDPTKKYPVIFYFYERNSDGLYNYRSPAPSASTINIPYFVSNGYLVFDPNIYYKTGEPGESAYNSVVSAAKHLSKLPYVDSSNMAIQGQSWGGYQVAYLITRTNMFKAAGAGAPVSNMTSAYGGIRWGPGMNRQFQYEKQQSRIGATLWERPDLYIKNSPLFAADKINTPLLIMHNDNDGAVPWYQGIEFFTALKRLDKKVWMLQYNNEDHNLMERKNRKDLSMRLSQFFDHYLKGAKPARWISEGLQADNKGRDWGFDN